MNPHQAALAALVLGIVYHVASIFIDDDSRHATRVQGSVWIAASVVISST